MIKQELTDHNHDLNIACLFDPACDRQVQGVDLQLLKSAKGVYPSAQVQ